MTSPVEVDREEIGVMTENDWIARKKNGESWECGQT
jgi:hypothetical protein